MNSEFGGGAGFMYSSAPRPVQTLSHKQQLQPRYRDAPSNLMFDKRVVRGPTVRNHALQNELMMKPVALPQHVHASEGKTHSSRSPINRNVNAVHRITTVSTPINSYEDKSASVQTDDYLEDLTDEVFEHDRSIQTEVVQEEWNQERVLALFAPACRGVDASTCIEGVELFDFDVEVEPQLAVLVGKILDLTVLEVNEENELALLEQQRAKFAAERAFVLAETARLEAENARRETEKMQRFEQERARLIEEQQLQEKRDAAMAAQRASIEQQQRFEAEQRAAWRDPVKTEIEQVFMPWVERLLCDNLFASSVQQQAIQELIDLSMKEHDHNAIRAA